MALLTQAAYDVQLAPVMTSTNWKRPWTDVEEGPSRPSSQTSPPSSQQSPSATSTRQGYDTADSTRGWRPDARSEGTAPANSSFRPQSLPRAPGDSHLQYPAGDAYTPSKRPRLEAPEPQSPFGSREDGPVDRKPVFGRHESFGLPPIGGRPEKETVESRRYNALSPVELLSSQESRGAGPPSILGPSQDKGTSIGPPNGPACPTCRQASSMAPRIVQGLAKLHTDLSTMWSSNPQTSSEKEPILSQDKPSSLLPSGILNSLDWSLEKLNESIDLARGMLGSRRAQEQEHHTRTLDRTSSGGSLLDKQDKWDETPSTGRHLRRSPPGSDDGMRHPDQLPPMFSDDRRRPQPLSTQQSPHPHYQGHHIPPQSPAQHQPPRSSFPPLPSPSSLTFTPGSQLPPMSPSLLSNPRSTPASSISGQPPTYSDKPPLPNPNTPAPPSLAPSHAPPDPRSPHASHLADLQHALSTKTLAQGVLQQEHDKLLAAYSRLQTRYGALERKTAVSDQEVNALVEERIRLSGSLEIAETMCEELRERGEERDRDVRVEREQWGRILEGAARLEREGLGAARGSGGRDGAGSGDGERGVGGEGASLAVIISDGSHHDPHPGAQLGASASASADAGSEQIKREAGAGPEAGYGNFGAAGSSGAVEEIRRRDELKAWRERAERAERMVGKYQAQALQVRSALGMLEGVGRAMEGIPLEG